MSARAQRGAALALGALASACTSTVAPPVERPRPEVEEPAAAIAIAPVSIAREGGEPVIRLSADGAIDHARCPGRVERDGTVRDAAGEIVLRLHDGAIARADGTALYTLDGSSLRRADGRRAILEGDRVTLEESPDVALSVTRDGADDAAVLLLFAALSACEAG